MTKTKKEKVCVDGEEAAELPAAAEGNGKSYHELVANVNPIAQPLASKKLSKKLYKCVKKGRSHHATTIQTAQNLQTVDKRRHLCPNFG